MIPHFIEHQNLMHDMTVYAENHKFNRQQYEYDEFILSLQSDGEVLTEEDIRNAVMQPTKPIHAYRVDTTSGKPMLHSLDYIGKPAIDPSVDNMLVYASKADVERIRHMNDAETMVMFDTMDDSELIRYLYAEWVDNEAPSPTVRLNMASRIDAM